MDETYRAPNSNRIEPNKKICVSSQKSIVGKVVCQMSVPLSVESNQKNNRISMLEHTIIAQLIPLFLVHFLVWMEEGLHI